MGEWGGGGGEWGGGGRSGLTTEVSAAIFAVMKILC